MFLNPSMSGLKSKGRVSLNYRSQWPGLHNAYTSYAITADKYFPTYRSGLGFYLVGDNAGDGIWNTYNAKIAYSYSLEMGKAGQLRLGFDFGAISSRINWNKLVFGNQIDPESGYNPNNFSEEIPVNGQTLTKFDASTGLLYYNKHLYAGLSFHHLNFPNLQYFDRDKNLEAVLPLRINFHGGTDIELIEEKRGQYGMSISPSLLLSKQGNFYQFQAQSMLQFNTVLLGAGFRMTSSNPDAVLLMLGGKFDYIQFAYSYDWTISGLSTKSGGAHEVSLVFEFGEDDDKDINDCMKLFR